MGLLVAKFVFEGTYSIEKCQVVRRRNGRIFIRGLAFHIDGYVKWRKIVSEVCRQEVVFGVKRVGVRSER